MDPCEWIHDFLLHLPAVKASKDRLCEDGIFMTLLAPSGELRDGVSAVGRESGRSADGQSRELHSEILDVCFVDDGCYMIAHKQGAVLVRRMRVLESTIVSIFSRFQLSVNMAKGKTEVMLALRGKNATTEREKLRGADGLWLDIEVLGNVGELTVNLHERRHQL